jgi:LPXTG-motif cell wall-anchored protein
VLAETVTAGDPSDNQACVLSFVTTPSTPVVRPPLARTGAENLYALLGGVLLLSGFGLVVLERRRRQRSPT